MGKNKKLILGIILAVIIIAYSAKRLLDYITFIMIDYYDGWFNPYASETIEQSQKIGSYLWEYEVDSIIKVDTFLIRLNYAFAEHIWYQSRKYPDSLIVDSFYWQAVIGVPQIKEYMTDNGHYVWDLQPEKWQSQYYGDSTIAFIYSNSLKKVPPKDTIKYYFLYNYRENTINGNGLLQKDTLTLYLTRKKED
jgi:hypothetical protein